MATIEIPIPDIARTTGNLRVRVRLEGRNYRLRLLFNTRSERWTLDLYDADAVAIVTGVSLVPFFPLLDLVTDDRRPPGELVLENTDGSETEPTLADFGLRSRLLYYEAA